MYSLVLMTAMTTTPDTADFNGYFRDLFFGNNCSGSSSSNAPRYNCYGGCSGSSYNCSGSSYNYSCSGSAYNCSGSAYAANCSGSYYNGCNGCNGNTFMNRVRRW